MIKRILRILSVPFSIIIVTPCIIQWIIMGRNLGMDLLYWGITGEWDY